MKLVLCSILFAVIGFGTVTMAQPLAFAQDVNVADNIAPHIIVPTNMSVVTNNASGLIVKYNATAIDNVDGIIKPTCVPPTGSLFAVGNTTVNCFAVDQAGNNSTASFNLEVTNVNKTLPIFVKNLAGLWCNGFIDSHGFVGGIQYLVTSKIVTLPSTNSTSGTGFVPQWVKVNACFWSRGQLSDPDFLSGIQYLVTVGIIKPGIALETTSTAISPSVSTFSGTPITLSAMVSDIVNATNMPTGIVSWSDNGTGGTFSEKSCTLTSGTCQTIYTPHANTNNTSIRADYGGDISHFASNGTGQVMSIITPAVHTTSLAIKPNPATSDGTAVTFNATVTDSINATSIPNGTISWSDGSAGGLFSTTSCSLTGGTCQTTYTPTTGFSTPITISASYAGDSGHSTSNSTSQLSRSADTTTTVILPNTITSNGSAITFNATVTDSINATKIPSGTVSWVDNGAGGTFSAFDCTLTSGFCTITYTPLASFTIVTLSGSYAGDALHEKSSANATITKSP